RPLVRSLYLDILQSLHPQADTQEFRRRREERNGASLEALHANRANDFAQINCAMLPLNELLRQQPFVAGEAPAYVDYIVLGTLQMPRVLGIEPWRRSRTASCAGTRGCESCSTASPTAPADERIACQNPRPALCSSSCARFPRCSRPATKQCMRCTMCPSASARASSSRFWGRAVAARQR